VLKLVTIRHKAVTHRDISVLIHRKSHLALHFSDFKTRRSLLNDKGLDTVPIIEVPSPNDNISECGVAYPAFLAIKDPATLRLARRCLQARGIASDLRLSQGESKDLFHRDSLRQKARFLLLIAQRFDHGHACSNVNN